MKKHIRPALDITIALMLPLLMMYSLTGEAFHEALGITVFALFIAHNILNAGWYRGLKSGRFDAFRVFRTALNALLLVYVFLEPLTGIILSRDIFRAISLPGLTDEARILHLAGAYWGYILASLHAGTHLGRLFRALGQKNRPAFTAVCAAAAVLCVCGCFAFFRLGFPGCLAGRLNYSVFVYNGPAF